MGIRGISEKKGSAFSSAGMARLAAAVILALLISAFCCLPLSCRAANQTASPAALQRFEAFITGPFDTAIKVILFTACEEEFNAYRLFIEEEFWRLHRLFDIYHDAPEGVNLKTVNDHAGTPVDCPGELMDLIEFGIGCGGEAGGRVNIAMGSVLSLWHDAREISSASPDRAYIPDQKSLEEAAGHTSIRDVVVDRARGTVTLKDRMMRLDVGAIAKGYAVEKIARQLARRGLQSGAIDAGGNVRVIGRNEGKNKPWRIGINNPLDNGRTPLVEIASVEDRAVVTSGNDQRFFIFEGRRYSHIIDPTTLQPAHFHDSVSIIAEDSGIADFLTTALMLMTEEEGRILLGRFPGCEALWVRGSSVTMTEGFRRFTGQAGD